MRIEQLNLSAATCLALSVMIAGCVKKETPDEVDPSLPAVTHVTPIVAGGKEPKCTLAWRAHGHTNQNEAKSFAANCLTAQDGAVDVTLSSTAVRTKLQGLISPDHALTAIEPPDIDVFCPGYTAASKEGRASFWQELLTAIARPESNYKTKTVLWETGKQAQYSLGLLQLSYNDRNSYDEANPPGCQFVTEAEVTNPDVNLECGVKIIAKLVKNGKPIGGNKSNPNSGGAAYWSTLRMSSPSPREEIISATSAIAACKAH
uniref:transglycosylase SLT domain-containing protein n=1 Tax=uncultured Rhizobium sp. TaxID=155567 RepID=UPI00262E1E9B|nr:transglycosylase SLT domain-containing protein [uncultured Rhizobium sp.]